jgi:hypothetical protein
MSVMGKAQNAIVQKDSVKIVVQSLHGDIVKGNKITNNYYLKNPKITIYSSPLNRELVFRGDTVLWDSKDAAKLQTIIVLSEIDFRFLSHPSFQFSFSEPVDTVLFDIGSRTGLSINHNLICYPAKK